MSVDGSPADAAPPTAPDMRLTLRERRRAIIAVTLGNGLEFYDFITFAFFAIQIGHTFFPSDSAFLSLMGSLATFFVGFLTRPLGAFVLGSYADRVGRKPAMLASMLLMGLGILLLTLTPGYDTIGYAAPVIAVIARMIQGFALGGEVGSATIYMMESALPEQRGWTMSWQGGSQQIAATAGALVGILLSLAMSPAALSTYGWRIALLLGIAVVPVALHIRRTLPETIHHRDSAPVENLGLRSYMRPVVCGAAIIGSGTIANFIFQYMSTYGQNTLGLSTHVSMAGEFTYNAVGFVAVMLGGAVSDRRGRRAVMLIPQLLFCALIVPCFLWLVSWHDATSFIGANVVLAFFSNYMYGGVYAAISESLPKAVRARVFALVYALPVTFLGGSTQLVVTWILEVTGRPMSIAWYLTAVSLIGFTAMYALEESAPVKQATLA